MEFLVVKNGKVKKQKKWHKNLFKGIQFALMETCPILDLNNEKLIAVINIDSFNKMTTMIFHWEEIGNTVLVVDNIVHEKDKLISMGEKLGLLRI